MWATAAGLVIIVVIVLFVLRKRIFRPLGSRPEELAMIVWAASGPFNSAADAEDMLSRSARAVFGPENYNKHAGWVDGHAENFRLWERQGNFQKSQEFMRLPFLPFARGIDLEQACRRLREEAQSLAQEGIERINNDILEATGRELRAETNPDGTLSLSYHQIWPESTICEEDASRATRIASAMGHKLLTTSSETGVRMREFLLGLKGDRTAGDLETTEDIGRIWLSCFDDSLSNGSESETTVVFKALNDAWWAEEPPV
jgi:hypothetical protein